ncbi:hypothetical protein EV702DRAFT_532853 [Suillus placidus]|uniref:Uncharacterized protein n=1 Tax=Suillus placidus TaxID=48579 RepID=A0A9P7D0B5_9AGAM|nr:hypothetical protein EV702DRAFT_532853 [Suillus placidus]
MFLNFPTFIQQSLCLSICTVARGQVVGPSENIPSECMASPTSVQLLVVWKDSDDDDHCPTQRQVRILERKIRRPPGWWVDYHHPQFWECVRIFLSNIIQLTLISITYFQLSVSLPYFLLDSDRHITYLTSTCSNQMYYHQTHSSCGSAYHANEFCVSSMTGHDPKKRFQGHSSHPYKAISTVIRQCQGV